MTKAQGFCFRQLAGLATVFAMAAAVWPTGVFCRTWLYQPSVPAKLRDS